MVIQRIQTLYLLLVAVLMGIFAFLPVIGANVDGNALAIGALGTCGVTQPSWLLFCLDALVVVLALIAIFKFKDLKGQMRLCGVMLLLLVALLACIAVIFVGQRGQCTAVLQWPIALPLVAMVFTMLARKGIKHDRKLLSDSERIR
ncbi:MAG: DUF4293 domain-containing protein [Muribaculaceae bacterium]|nr:DUF4293 domain-containing protein [Muribaculaceae bacterium]